MALADVKDWAFPASRASNGCYGRGILKFDEKTKRMYLAGYYPTSSPEDVIENTGFEIDVSRAVELEAPEPSVIKLIREEIDPGQAFIKVPVPEAKIRDK